MGLIKTLKINKFYKILSKYYFDTINIFSLQNKTTTNLNSELVCLIYAITYHTEQITNHTSNFAKTEFINWVDLLDGNFILEKNKVSINEIMPIFADRVNIYYSYMTNPMLSNPIEHCCTTFLDILEKPMSAELFKITNSSINDRENDVIFSPLTRLMYKLKKDITKFTK